MFGDDDDGVEPQFEAVQEYYFKDDDEHDICFSILPFQFDENDKTPSCDFKKRVYLRGHADTKQGDIIHIKVVAWRIGFENKQPNILVLSERKWIKLLKPRRIYAEKVSRSILITIEMLHFVRQQPRDMRSLWDCLWIHLNEVFSKFGFKPTVDDLRMHHSLIKLFTERDRILMNSKFLHTIIEGGYMKTKECTKVKSLVDGVSRGSNSDEDDVDYDGNWCNNDGDYGYSGDDGNDDENSCNEVDNDDAESSDGHSDNEDGADPICTICDDGGKLLRTIRVYLPTMGIKGSTLQSRIFLYFVDVHCKGQCKRAFHATKEHGRNSGCETLGYTKAQRKRIVTFICENCKYQQHQCFKCGELEPSDEPNAKVFQCNDASCGHFYHPKCIAKLLEPDNTGACELEKRIMAGMSFTCPVHWCFKCKRMEDKTTGALQLAEISFEAKGKTDDPSAWKLPQIIFFYCLDHIDKATEKVRRDHIKFPPIPKICETRDPARKRGKMTGKRKNNTGQHSTRPTELSKRSCRKDCKHYQTVATNSSSVQTGLELDCDASEQFVLESDCAAKHLKEGMQFKPSMVEVAANLSGEAVKGLEKQAGTSSSFTVERTPMSTSYVVGGAMEKRVTSTAEQETASGTAHVTPPIRGIFHHSVQPGVRDLNCKSKNAKCTFPPSFSLWGCPDTMQENKETTGTHSPLCVEQNPFGVNQQLDIPLVDKDAEWNNGNCRTSGDKYGNGTEKKSEQCLRKQLGNAIKDTSNLQNDVFDNFNVERDTEDDGTNLQSGKEKDAQWGESSCGPDPLSQQAGEICRRENRICEDQCEQDYVDDHPPEKLVHFANIDKMGISNRIDSHQEFGSHEDQEFNESYECQQETDSCQSNGNPKTINIDNLFDKSRMREAEEKATTGKKVDLDTNRKYNHAEDEGAIHPPLKSSHQCHANHKEPDFIVSELNSSQCNAESRAAETLEDKSNRREELLQNREGSCNSPLGINACISRNLLPERRRMGYYDNCPTTSNHPRYEQRRHVNCSCIDYFTCRKYRPLECDDYFNFKFSGCHVMDIGPFGDSSNTAFGPSMDVRVGGHEEVYAGSSGECGVRSVYQFGWEPRTPATVSVTGMYAPLLEQSICQPNWPMLRPPCSAVAGLDRYPCYLL
ncbi:hypothetical protein ACP70R_022394 [Stipagrostis hirtigluma subsp. patula]